MGGDVIRSKLGARLARLGRAISSGGLAVLTPPPEPDLYALLVEPVPVAPAGSVTEVPAALAGPPPPVDVPNPVVITLVVVEVPPRAPYDGNSVRLTVWHGSRVTVTLDDTGRIREVVTYGPEPTDNVQTEYPTQKEQ